MPQIEKRVGSTFPIHAQNPVLSEGIWDENISWEFILSSELPDASLCTAVCCIVTFEGKLLLVKNKRGWEFPAGHIKPGENLEKAVSREVKEEACALINKPQVLGYKKLTALEQIPHRDEPTLFYPFPHSMVVYYYADASGFSNESPKEDIEEVKLTSYDEAKELLTPGGQYENILEYLLENEMIHLE